MSNILSGFLSVSFNDIITCWCCNFGWQDERSKNWRVHAVAISPEMFESRQPLPQCWRGLMDDELSERTGIPGCLFVHISGFIGVNQTYEGALAMATTALTTPS